MEWIKADPIPKECKNCQEPDCYNCDAAGAHWMLSREDELRCRRLSLIRAINRLQRQVEAIDEELLPLTDQQRAALDGKIEMSYDLFWECLEVCFSAGDMKMYHKIWNDYPEHIATVLNLRNTNKRT